jgi:hypothetical protein
MDSQNIVKCILCKPTEFHSMDYSTRIEVCFHNQLQSSAENCQNLLWNTYMNGGLKGSYHETIYSMKNFDKFTH